MVQAAPEDDIEDGLVLHSCINGEALASIISSSVLQNDQKIESIEVRGCLDQHQPSPLPLHVASAHTTNAGFHRPGRLPPRSFLPSPRDTTPSHLISAANSPLHTTSKTPAFFSKTDSATNNPTRPLSTPHLERAPTLVCQSRTSKLSIPSRKPMTAETKSSRVSRTIYISVSNVRPPQ